MERVRIKVVGLVQGVFFRANTQKTAKALELLGWIRNMPDGSVEIVAEGRKQALDELVSWCRKGPPSSRIDKVSADFKKAENEFTGFRIES